MNNFAISDRYFPKNTSGNFKQVDVTGVGQVLYKKYSPFKKGLNYDTFLACKLVTCGVFS